MQRKGRENEITKMYCMRTGSKGIAGLKLVQGTGGFGSSRGAPRVQLLAREQEPDYLLWRRICKEGRQHHSPVLSGMSKLICIAGPHQHNHGEKLNDQEEGECAGSAERLMECAIEEQ